MSLNRQDLDLLWDRTVILLEDSDPDDKSTHYWYDSDPHYNPKHDSHLPVEGNPTHDSHLEGKSTHDSHLDDKSTHDSHLDDKSTHDSHLEGKSTHDSDFDDKSTHDSDFDDKSTPDSDFDDKSTCWRCRHYSNTDDKSTHDPDQDDESILYSHIFGRDKLTNVAVQYHLQMIHNHLVISSETNFEYYNKLLDQCTRVAVKHETHPRSNTF